MWNIADVTSAAVKQLRHSRWGVPAMANATYLRLFGFAFGVIGVIFLVSALTNNIQTKAT